MKALYGLAQAILLRRLPEPVPLKYIDTFTEMHINIHFILAKTIVRCESRKNHSRVFNGKIREKKFQENCNKSEPSDKISELFTALRINSKSVLSAEISRIVLETPRRDAICVLKIHKKSCFRMKEKSHKIQVKKRRRKIIPIENFKK